MKRFILYLWQLPQNLVGLAMSKVCKCEKIYSVPNKVYFYVAQKFNSNWSGISLGNYIIFSYHADNTSIKHEHGHQKQSLYFGWLYLILIGLPSFVGNLWDRIAHKKMDNKNRIKWYYNQPWEKWADKLGDVKRTT
jgi:hypothetical protein